MLLMVLLRLEMLLLKDDPNEWIHDVRFILRWDKCQNELFIADRTCKKVFAEVDHITSKVVVLYIVRILKPGRSMISLCIVWFTKKIEATIPFEKCAF